MTKTMTPAQIRGARGMLGWSVMDLASAAGLPVPAVEQMEGEDPQPSSLDTKLAVWDAFTLAAVVFITSEDCAGVKLRKPASPEHTTVLVASPI